MGLGNVSGAADDGGNARVREQSRLGAVGDLVITDDSAPLSGQGDDVGVGRSLTAGSGGLNGEVDVGAVVLRTHHALEAGRLGAESLDERFTIHRSQGTELELHARLGGDRVDGDAAADRIRRHRGEGHDIVLIEGTLCAELGGDCMDEGDELGGVGNRVHTLWGQRGMCRDAVEVDTEDVHRLVSAHDPHARRLTDDAAAWGHARLGDLVDEVDRAHTADLFVIGEGEVDGLLEIRGCQLGQFGEDDTDEGFHVRAAAGVELAVPDLRGEGIARPVLTVDRYDIGVPGQDDATAGGTIGGGQCGQQVCFGSLGVGHTLRFDACGLETVDDVVDEWEIGIPARGVEGDEIGDLGNGGLGRLCWHGCS